MSILSTTVVQFGENVDPDAMVVVELDEVVNLDAEGKEKTSFVPGDEPGFLVHFDPAALRVDKVISSSGMVVGRGLVSRTRGQQLSFTLTGDGQELPHIPSGPVTVDWYGNSPVLSQDGRMVSVSGAIPAIGEVSYPINTQAYTLIPPPLDLAADDSWPILVVVYMEAA